jgi:hypothetical protein
MVNCCNGGPCCQGRAPCPTPEACELEETSLYATRIKDAVVAVLLVFAIIAYVVLSSWRDV